MYQQLQGEQLDRYEQCRRSHFRHSTLKRVMAEHTSGKVDRRCLIAMGSLAKSVVAELVETARALSVERGVDPEAALQADEIWEAYGILLRRGLLPHAARGHGKLSLS